MFRNRARSLPIGVYLTLCAIVGSVMALSGALFSGPAGTLAADEELLLFPGLAHRSATPGEAGDRWLVEIQAYVYEPERDSLKRRALLNGLREALDVEEATPAARILEDRARMFLVDHERGKRIRIEMLGREFYLPGSPASGHIRGSFLLPAGSFRAELLRRRNPWVAFRAPIDAQRQVVGEVQVVDAVGVSIVSDIDDTIKISEVLNKEMLLRRTFLREFEAVPGMAALYRAHEREGIAFHYVSGSPWQLYPALREFMTEAGFPAGSFYLRELRLKSILDFASADPFQYKFETISRLLRRFPRREFVLIGDSGEQDPEVYTEIARNFARQVRAIFIRDVRGRGEIAARVRALRSRIPGKRFVVFRDVSEIASVRF